MIKLSAAVVGRLLDGLSQDDAFREAFTQDPRAALRSIGHETPDHHVGVEGHDPVMPFLQPGTNLADKEQIAAGRERLVSSYESASLTSLKGVAFGPQDLCAS